MNQEDNKSIHKNRKLILSKEISMQHSQDMLTSHLQIIPVAIFVRVNVDVRRSRCKINSNSINLLVSALNKVIETEVEMLDTYAAPINIIIKQNSLMHIEILETMLAQKAVDSLVDTTNLKLSQALESVDLLIYSRQLIPITDELLNVFSQNKMAVCAIKMQSTFYCGEDIQKLIKKR